MTRRLLMVLFMLLGLCTSRVQAQLFGGDIVFDPTNFAKNAITATQMIEQVKQMTLQVGNSNAEVQMMLQNLVTVLGARYDYLRYANLMREVLDTVNGGVPMHYDLPNINAVQLDVYRGYTTATKWGDWAETYGNLAQTALNAQRGMLNTVHEELSPDDDARVDSVMDDLRAKAEAASGNKDLAQLHAYGLDLQLYEARRTRRMLGALTDAIVLKNEHDLNLNAWTQNAQDNFLSGGAFDPQPYTGAGGVTEIKLD